MKASLRVLAVLAAGLVFAAVIGAAGFYVAREYYAAELPSVASLHEIKLGVPLRVYTRDGKLIGEFGAERREPLRFDQIPKPLTQAFLAAEDDRFFEHSGVDINGLLRASVVLLTTGEKRQGGSTITMQLARNVFLSSERSFARKFKEILLARKIETELSKQQILELYLNRIFLGNRAYGVGAAAQIYFGKEVRELSLSEMATIAGLPKAPSRDNPLNNPKRARERRDYVLRRMRDLGYIGANDYQTAFAEPITAFEHAATVEIEARYVAEMVRADLYAKFGEGTYTDGYSVTTTLDSARQSAATASLRGGLIAYGERHGFGGPEARLPEELVSGLAQKAASPRVRAQLEARQPVAGLLPAVVLSYSPELLRLQTVSGAVELPRPGFQWANLDKKPLHVGDIVRVAKIGAAWRLTEVPDVQGAFVALNPRDGAVQALVGGFDFFLGNFNRVIQARRQVGSGFKPLLYTAALSKGYTPASMFLDAPVVFTSSVSPDDDWRPGNYEGKFKGPMRLREALTLSRNLVSVRVGQAVGINYARDFATRFGIARDRVPDDLTLALGSAALTPMEQARAYCVFANGGYLVDPYYVESIRNGKGEEIFHAKPKQACPECDTPSAPVDPQGLATSAGTAPTTEAAPAAPPVAPEDRAPRTLAPDLDFLITSMMHDVVTRGTAAQVKSMGRDDLAGKTGTSNDETDAWFNGFAQQQLVGVVWVGYDKPAPLGKGEVGGRAAVPIWMDFMKTALRGLPQLHFAMPSSLVPIMINPANGKLAADGTPGAIPEIVQADHLPPPDDGKSAFGDGETPGSDIY